MKVSMKFSLKDVEALIRERLKNVDVGFEWKEPKIEFKNEYYRSWFEVTIDNENEEIPVAPRVNLMELKKAADESGEPALPRPPSRRRPRQTRSPDAKAARQNSWRWARRARIQRWSSSTQCFLMLYQTSAAHRMFEASASNCSSKRSFTIHSSAGR